MLKKILTPLFSMFLLVHAERSKAQCHVDLSKLETLCNVGRQEFYDYVTNHGFAKDTAYTTDTLLSYKCSKPIDNDLNDRILQSLSTSFHKNMVSFITMENSYMDILNKELKTNAYKLKKSEKKPMEGLGIDAMYSYYSSNKFMLTLTEVNFLYTFYFVEITAKK